MRSENKEVRVCLLRTQDETYSWKWWKAGGTNNKHTVWYNIQSILFSGIMSVGFIGAGQLAQALVRGFSVAGKFRRLHLCFNRFWLVFLTYEDCNHTLKLFLDISPLQGVIATHRITASSPDTELPTVQQLRVGTYIQYMYLSCPWMSQTINFRFEQFCIFNKYIWLVKEKKILFIIEWID